MQTSHNILYVDDDIDDFILFSEAFERYTDDGTVVHAGNGAEGLSMLREMDEREALPCLLVIDINMPLMDGRRMLEELKRLPRYKDIPVIILSTSASPRDRLFAEKLGADFVTKPVSYNELKSLVRQFVTKYV